MLSKFYEIMKRASKSKDGQLWNQLSAEEKKELLLIDKETNDPKNLIPHSKIQEKHKEWL